MEPAGNDTEHEAEEFTPTAFLIPWGVVCGMIALCTVVGNVLVIYSFMTNRSLRTRGNSLVISLAVVDFLTGLLCMPLKIAVECTMKHHESPIHNGFDATWTTLDLVFGISSVLHLTAISLERYAAICWPFRHRTTSRTVYSVSIGLAWLLGFLAMALIQASILLEWERYAYIILCMMFFVVPLLIILTTYCAIWHTVKKSLKRKSEREMNQAAQDDVRKQQVRMSVTMALVVCAFTVTWAPQFVNATVTILCPECEIRPIYFIVKAIQYLGSAVNPVIYAIRMPEFKRTLSRKSKSSATSSTYQTSLSLSAGDKKSRSSSNSIPMEPIGSRKSDFKSNNNDVFKGNTTENHDDIFEEEIPVGNVNHAFEEPTVFDTRF